MNTDHEIISEFLESARYMPPDLQRDPSGLLRVCLRIMRDSGDDPRALTNLLELCMTFICARHRKQIIGQLQQAAYANRQSMH
ncbi:MAG: hypothetical protein IPK63_23805 [Candidatus Competibacteraceae bacterium]|nr:hypothetical protein [Candidatus Competibacteraceae bacterium]MBK8184928.1 hypothetical protein [Candidatus Competibacteraceae bacterium]MBK8184953.1 hypothetical protein [Candidatus Competibacteraceae bacterium]MBK8185756.1 hypothetical protein [Candidatus Competibacteraceae bacterium]